jgi:hypothetical protein
VYISLNITTKKKFMKKSFLAVTVFLGTSTLFAQDLTSKKGEAYLPVAGDYAIGIDAAPFLTYIGNFIGGNGLNTAPTWNFLTTNQTITGKYFKEDNLAYRVGIRLGFGSTKGSNMIGQDFATAPVYPALPLEVKDSWKSGGSNIGITGGLEWRRGKGRLQGFYGAELGLAFGTSKTTFEYGNAMTITGAGTTDFSTVSGAPANITTDTYGNGARINEAKGGTTVAFGLRAFIGAEYFVLPKLSIGGEFGWGVGLSSVGAGSTTIESTDGATVGSQTIEGTKSSSFGLDTDINNTLFGSAGSLRIAFHF